MIPFLASIRAGASPDIDACIAALGVCLPALREFADTPQDPGWHAEGDVRVHTGMVLDALYADLATSPLPPDERLALVLATLLHDIAKPMTTRSAEVNGRTRIVARGHEARGRSWLAPRLLPLGLPFSAIESIIGLVGSHHEPKGMLKRAAAPGEWHAMARRADPELLARLELADMRGRTCDDWHANVEAIELFGLQAEEFGVRGWATRWREELGGTLGRMPPVARDRAFGEALRGVEAGRWVTPDGAAWLAHAAAARISDFVLLVGPSGAGKSTFVERHLPGFDIVSMDALRKARTGRQSDQTQNGQVRQAAREALKVSLRAGRNVVWDATSLRSELRAPLLQLGFDYGALVTIVTLLEAPEAYHRRNRRRATAVPDSVVEDQLEALELPTVQEAHRTLFVGQDGVLAAHGILGEELPYELGWAPGR